MFKNEKDIRFLYGYDILIDASNSIDEANLRSKRKIDDPLLLFSWECPQIFASLCEKLNTPRKKNSKFLLKYSDYKNLLKIPDNDIEFEIKLKLQKDDRDAEKSLKFILKKPIEITEKKSENNTEADNKIEEIDLTQLIVIESEFLGATDILFNSTLIDPNLDMKNYKYNWNIPHFRSNSQYLNGRKETN